MDESPKPTTYIDTDFYYGGHNYWYEAYTEVNLLWECLLDLVLKRHSIQGFPPWQPVSPSDNGARHSSSAPPCSMR